MTRTRVLFALAVLVLAGAAAFWRYRATAHDGTFKYETAAVDRGRVVARVTATGTLSALVTVQVGSQVSGTISALSADFNTRVHKGQVIARIDPRLFQAAVDSARANVVAAQGNLAKAKAQAVDAQRQLGRTRELADRKLVAMADLDTAQANADALAAAVTAAEGSVAQTQAALSQASLSLAYTSIVSPTDGVVISRSVDVGQTVAASLQAPVLFVIAEDLAKMQVDTSVAEADVGRLSAGMQATFTVDAYPGQVFQGKVRQVRNAAQTVQNVVTYDAVVDVQNPELKLKPGMTATVTFIYAQRDDVVRVPNAALRFRPPSGMPRPQVASAAGPGGDARRGGAAADEGTPRARGDRPGGATAASGTTADPPGGTSDDLRRTVWVLRNGQPEPVKVRTGISDGSLTELVQGDLSPGDAVITDASGRAGASSGGSGGGQRGGGPPRLF